MPSSSRSIDWRQHPAQVIDECGDLGRILSPIGLGIRDVGRGTVELMLIFMQDRLDVLPIEDYGMRNGFSNATGREVRVTPNELKRQGSEWSPCRSVIAWYFWPEANIT